MRTFAALGGPGRGMAGREGACGGRRSSAWPGPARPARRRRAGVESGAHHRGPGIPSAGQAAEGGEAPAGGRGLAGGPPAWGSRRGHGGREDGPARGSAVGALARGQAAGGRGRRADLVRRLVVRRLLIGRGGTILQDPSEDPRDGLGCEILGIGSQTLDRQSDQGARQADRPGPGPPHHRPSHPSREWHDPDRDIVGCRPYYRRSRCGGDRKSWPGRSSSAGGGRRRGPSMEGEAGGPLGRTAKARGRSRRRPCPARRSVDSGGSAHGSSVRRTSSFWAVHRSRAPGRPPSRP